MILKAYNLNLTEGQPRSKIVVDAASGDSSITVANYTELKDNDYLLIGEFGSPVAEIVQINDGSIDSTVSLDSSLLFDHYSDTHVTVLPYNQVQFFRSTSDVDANSDDSSLSKLNGNIDVQPNREYTIYKDNTNSSGYGYIRFYNSQTAQVSQYSESINYEGRPSDSVGEIIDNALRSLGLQLGDEYCDFDSVIRDINEAQTQIATIDNWLFELINDNNSIVVTQNENQYSLSNLTYPLKHNNNPVKSILNLRLGSELLDYVDPNEMDALLEDTTRTTVASPVTAGDSSIELTDTSELAGDGTVYIGDDIINYTSKDDSTNTISGCSGVDNNHAVGDTVWQGITTGVPEKYTIFNGKIILNRPIPTSRDGYKLKLKYLKQLDYLEDYSQQVEIPFYQVLEMYIRMRVESRRRSFEESDRHKKEFWDTVKMNRDNYKVPLLEEQTYYIF